MAENQFTQADLDNVTSELKQAVADAANRVSTQLGLLQQSSPTFNADVASLQGDLAALAAIAPATAQAQANTASQPTDPGAPAQAPVADQHTELVQPPATESGNGPENTNATPQVQADAQNNVPAPVGNAPAN